MQSLNATVHRNRAGAALAILIPLVLGTASLHATDVALVSSRVSGAPHNIQGNTNMKHLLDTYYAGLKQKSGWQDSIADDFHFIGGNNMTKAEPMVGKAAYQGVIQRFSRVFTAMRVKDLVVAGDRAFALTNYDYSLPNGKTASGDVVEVWKGKDGKLTALTIYFDTLSFAQLTK
jgi:ketosteroid isomerase-like protein